MADIDFEEVQLGTAPTGVGGDVPRTAFGKITRNFNKIKAFFADSSNAASRKVGTEAGDVLENGEYGFGRSSAYDYSGDITGSGFYSWANGDREEVDGIPDGISRNGAMMLNIPWQSGDRHRVQLWAQHNRDRYFFRGKYNGVLRDPGEILHTRNTTTDSNGFIKAASPIIKLFNDKIEKTDHLEIQSASLEKLGTGKYKLTGVPELSRDGWYIETPKDRNNNIYFTLDYEENNGELIIKTYEPDYSSGRAENGAPVDILEGRFVSLRFAENPELYPEPEDE